VTILHRAPIALLAAVAVLAAVPMLTLGSTQKVIDDYRDNGVVDGCYSTQDFNQAMRELDPQDASYEDASAVIRYAQARCASPGAVPDGDGGSGGRVWIGIAVAVGFVSLGAVALARRPGGRGSGTDGGGTGSDRP